MNPPPLPPCPPGLICSQLPPVEAPGVAPLACPQATRAFPIVSCVIDGRVIVHRFHHHHRRGS